MILIALTTLSIHAALRALDGNLWSEILLSVPYGSTTGCLGRPLWVNYIWLRFFQGDETMERGSFCDPNPPVLVRPPW